MIYGNELFSAVPEGFFGVLTGPGKEANTDILLRTYDYIEQQTETMKISREDYDRIAGNVFSETDEDYQSSDAKRSQNHLFWRFVETGWFVVEKSFDGRDQYITFTPPAITQLRALKSIIAPSRVSMGEYVRTALRILKDLTRRKTGSGSFSPYSMLSHAEEDIQHFNNGFTKLDEECKRRLKKMLTLDNADTKTVISDIQDMLNELNDGMFAKLNKEEVLDGTISDFEDCIHIIREDRRLREEMVREASFGMESPDTERIQDDIDAKLSYIYNQICNACRPRQRELYETVSAYFRTARRKLMMSVNPSGKGEHLVREMIEAMENAMPGSEEYAILQKAVPMLLPAGCPVTGGQLYVPRNAPVRFLEEDPYDTQEVEISSSDIAALGRKYSRKKIADYYDTLLGKRSELLPEDISIDSREDFDRMICLFIYADNGTEFPFSIERTGKRASGPASGYPEFILRRKERKNA